MNLLRWIWSWFHSATHDAVPISTSNPVPPGKGPTTNPRAPSSPLHSEKRSAPPSPPPRPRHNHYEGGEKILGIDLGTANAVVAVMEGGEVTVIANQEGSRLTPSVVAFTDNGERLVGDPARRQAITNPRRTVYSIKRFMGRRRKEVVAEEKRMPYQITGSLEDAVRIDIDGKRYTPPEISGMILRKLKEAAEAHLGHSVHKAVITVPAYFNDAQRQATLEAARIAGFETEWELQDPGTGKKIRQRMRIINEATAASLAFSRDKRECEAIAVFDLGGGMFNISILNVGEAVFKVEGVNGDMHLGGDDFDQVLIDYFADQFKANHDIDPRKDQMALQRLKEAAEQAKKDLSQQTATDIDLPYLTADASGPKHLRLSLTRTKFEQLVDPLVERCRGPILKALADAKKKPEDFDEVVLVGGMTRLPKIQWLIKDIFGKEGNRGVNPDEAVAVGAAIQGAQLVLGSQSEVQLVDVTPLSLGLETLGGRLTRLIERNTTIPVERTQTFSTTADNQAAVTFSVYQGESEIAKSQSNRLLGEFNLEGIRPAPRGEPQIEVTFSLDTNGVLTVKAKDKDTGKEAKIEVKGSSGLSPREVERMRQETETYAARKSQQRELLEARNQADSLIFSIEKTLKEHADKIDEASKMATRSAVEQMREKMQGDDTAAIKQATHDLRYIASGLQQVVQRPSPGQDDLLDAPFEAPT